MEVYRNDSIQFLTFQFEKRTRTDREHWLLDISSYASFQSAVDDLNHLNIDIDDDIFLCKQVSTTEYQFWEAYKISPDLDLIVKSYGKWNSSTMELNVTEISKPWRRKDLMGYHFLVTTQYSEPWITNLTDKSMSGSFGEIFTELKVSISYIATAYSILPLFLCS